MSVCMPPRSPATADPAFCGPAAGGRPPPRRSFPLRPPPPRWAATAAARDPRSLIPARRPGATMSMSSTSGSAEWTPPTTGATSRSSTRRPIRARTSAATLVASAVVPSEAGSSLSSEARSEPARPSERRTSGSQGLAGMPRTPVRGSSRGPSGSCTQAPPGFGATMLSAMPSSAARSATARGAGGEGLRAAVQGQAGHRMAADAAAPRAGGLQDRGPDAGAGQRPGGEQAGDAAAHHHGGLPCPRQACPAASMPLLRGDGVDKFDDARQHGGIGVRRHAVAEVQHVSRG